MKKSVLAMSVGLALFGVSAANAADPAKIDWSKIKPVTVPLFYPGQSSYEWLRSDAHKGAAKEVAGNVQKSAGNAKEDMKDNFGKS